MPYKVVRCKKLEASAIRELNYWESKGWRVVSHSVSHAGFKDEFSVILHRDEEEVCE